MRTSRPVTTRWRPPSCHTLARSTPNTRKRSVESAKSNGPGTARNATPGPYRRVLRLRGAGELAERVRGLVDGRVARGVARRRSGTAELRNHARQPRVDLRQQVDLLVRVLPLRIRRVRRALLQRVDAGLDVAVDLGETVDELLRELRAAVALPVVANDRVAQVNELEPQAQDLDAHAEDRMTGTLRRSCGSSRRGRGVVGERDG